MSKSMEKRIKIMSESRKERILEERIEVIEKRAFSLGLFGLASFLPGTSLSRIFDSEVPSGIIWALGLGGMLGEKQFFFGKTISEAIDKAEKYLDEISSGK